jgi:hypothetical protein
MIEITEKANVAIKEFLKTRDESSPIRVLPWTGD